MTDWLSALVVGDRVVVDARYNLRVAVVARVTATQIQVETCKYRRTDGRRIGSSTWDMAYLREATGPLLEKARKAGAIALLRGTKWETLPDARVLEIAEIVIRAEWERAGADR